MMNVEIIAELAQGFEGKPEQARLLMKAAAAAGADAVKYQLVYADELATPDYKYYDLFRSLEMPDETWEGLAAYADELGIKLYLDVFGSRSLELAERLGLKVVKLHPTDISNIAFLERIAQSRIQRVLVGAGGACGPELERAMEILSGKEVVLLLGFQGYPTPNEANQIARVRLFVGRYTVAGDTVAIGFADHAPPETPLRYALAASAIGAGAQVIEKHLTLGQVMKLEDFESALNPDLFSEFCEVIRGCAAAVGELSICEDFGMSDDEKSYRRTIRRHVVSSRDLPAGTLLRPSDLVLKRAAAEEVITELEVVYGRTVIRPVLSNSPLSPGDLT